MKVFCISLAKSVERREHIRKQFRASSIQPVFYEATDDKPWQRRDIEERLCPELMNLFEKHGDTWFTKGAVGCADSHRTLYRQIAAGEDSYACILEDDASVTSDFDKILTYCEEKGSELGLGLIYLCYQGISAEKPLRLPPRSPFQILDRFLHAVPSPQLRSSAGYMVSREAARKLADFQYPKIQAGADWWRELQEGAEIQKAGLVYPACCQAGDFASTLGYTAGSSLARLVKSIESLPIGQKIVRAARRKRFQINSHVLLDSD